MAVGSGQDSISPPTVSTSWNLSLPTQTASNNTSSMKPSLFFLVGLHRALPQPSLSVPALPPLSGSVPPTTLAPFLSRSQDSRLS